MSAAPSAVEHRTKVAARIVTGSVGLTSYSCDSTRRPNAQTQGSAIAVPPAIMTSASRSTSQRSEERRVGKECRSRGARYNEKKKEGDRRAILNEVNRPLRD